TVAVTRDGTWAVSAPRIDQVPNGSGDLLAALYLAARLAQRDVTAALTAACSAVDGVLRASAGADELRLVAAQAEVVQPTRVLAADAVR
ncbi:MAG: pyridoxal kinase, partial [Alphaproteobacteria bacterium]|nr:pyridoxal kinase [Alphaproteobacteria bacterium]